MAPRSQAAWRLVATIAGSASASSASLRYSASAWGESISGSWRRQASTRRSRRLERHPSPPRRRPSHGLALRSGTWILLGPSEGRGAEEFSPAHRPGGRVVMRTGLNRLALARSPGAEHVHRGEESQMTQPRRSRRRARVETLEPVRYSVPPGYASELHVQTLPRAVCMVRRGGDPEGGDGSACPRRRRRHRPASRAAVERAQRDRRAGDRRRGRREADPGPAAAEAEREGEPGYAQAAGQESQGRSGRARG